MTGDVDISRASAADEPAILALAEAALGWEPGGRSAGFFHWKHDENAFGRSPRWVAKVDGEVVGFRVFMRWRFRGHDGETASAVRAVDTATHPDHQGKGIFTKLTLHALDELVAEGVDFVFNTPNDKSRPGYLKMGWVELGRPPVGVRPKLGAVPRVAKARVPAELWSEPCAAGVDAREAFADDADADKALALAGHPVRLATDRTPAYLRWRYGHEPLRYRVVGQDGKDGVAVFRTRRRGPALEATIADVLAPSPAARRRLVRRVLRESGADYLLVAAPDAVDLTPLVRMSGLSPLVTWRALCRTDPPALADLGLSLGDLELF